MSLLVHSHGRIYDLTWREFLVDPEVSSKGTRKVMYDHGKKVSWTNDAHEYISHYDSMSEED